MFLEGVKDKHILRFQLYFDLYMYSNPHTIMKTLATTPQGLLVS